MVDGPENFRLSRDNNTATDGVLAFSDSVVTAVRVVPEPAPAFDPGGPYPRTTTSLRRKTRRCTTCERFSAMATARSGRYQIASAREIDGEIEGVAKRADGRVLTIRLRPFGAGVMLPLQAPSRTGEPSRLITRAYVGWTIDPLLRTWVASRVERFNTNNRVTDATVWVGADRFTSEEFRPLTRMPSPAGTDPIRGSASFTTFWDFRHGAGTITQIADGNPGPVTLIAPALLPDRASSSGRPMLWVAAGALVALLVMVRILTSRRSTAKIGSRS